MPKRTKTRNRAKYDVRLPGHEKILLGIYRALTPENRLAVDRVLATAWLRQPATADRGLSRTSRQLKAGNVSGSHVAYFVSLVPRDGAR